MPPKGTLGLAMAAWKGWQRLSPAQRKAVMKQVKKRGPRAAASLAGYLRRLR